MSKLKQLLFSLNDTDRKTIEEKLKEKDQQIDQLKQQLTEKQNTIDEINKEFVQAVRDWKTLCAEKDKEIENLRQIINTIQQNIRQYNKEDYEDKQLLYQDIDMLKQNQTKLTIQELEKVKNYVDGRTYCADYINKRIQELKGE